MKKILSIVVLLLSLASCAPVKYVMIDPKDSTKLVEVKKRIIYDDYYVQTPPPFRYNNWWLYGAPYYSPRIIIQRPIRPQPSPYRPAPPRTFRNK